MSTPDDASVPDVTVVIPVYNTVAYLRECVDSLLAQSIGHARLEVLAVDDGSTDGSGELLDEYAATYPDVVRVVHQPNSGGPAAPCNVGLGLARGRFVFFLGSDDHLAHDGLERLVTAADEWESDVVVPPMVGVNGRYVDQRLFARDVADLAFPHSALPFSLGNTKLFRRSMLEEHAIRYALDLRVGSDQPFTIAAMVAARRISVLARPHIYFAVRRDDAENISYSTDWRDRLDAVVAVIDHICTIVPAGPDRDAIVRRHFAWELNKILVRNLAECPSEERADLVARLAVVAEEHLTPGVDRLLKVEARLRWWHVRRGDVAALLGLAERMQPTVLVDGGELFMVLPGFRDGVPDDIFRPTGDRVIKMLQRGLGEHHVEVVGDRLEFSADGANLAPATFASLRLALIPIEGAPPAVRTTTAPAADTGISVAVDRADANGRIGAAIGLRELAGHPGRWSARWQLGVGADVYDMPVRSAVQSSASVRRHLRTATVHLASGTKDRVVVEVRS